MNSNICQYSLILAYFCFFNNRRKFVILVKIGFDWFDCLSREMSAAYFTVEVRGARYEVREKQSVVSSGQSAVTRGLGGLDD
jgi:hypothetical protein